LLDISRSRAFLQRIAELQKAVATHRAANRPEIVGGSVQYASVRLDFRLACSRDRFLQLVPHAGSGCVECEDATYGYLHHNASAQETPRYHDHAETREGDLSGQVRGDYVESANHCECGKDAGKIHDEDHHRSTDSFKRSSEEIDASYVQRM